MHTSYFRVLELNTNVFVLSKLTFFSHSSKNVEKFFHTVLKTLLLLDNNITSSINKYILEERQTSWNNSIGNKLLDIKPTIGEYQSVVRNIRREEVVLARLRLGHTRVTHSYLLQGEEHPQCVGCDAPLTVRHFLLECGDFAQVRNNCFHVYNMKELFQDIHIDSIMTYLRQINLFNKI